MPHKTATATTALAIAASLLGSCCRAPQAARSPSSTVTLEPPENAADPATQKNAQRERDWVRSRDAFLDEHHAALLVERRALDGETLAAGQQRLSDFCHAQLRSTQSFERCQVSVLGKGSVLLITLVTECGGDSCSTEGFVRNRDRANFQKVPIDVGGSVEAAPDGSFLVYDWITDINVPGALENGVRDPFGGQEALVSGRLDLTSLKSTAFSQCFSPRLSPGGRWFVCRDRSANVLRVPVAGGIPKIVVASSLTPEQVDFVWYAYVWPEPVEFIGPGRFSYVVQTTDGERRTLEAPFTE